MTTVENDENNYLHLCTLKSKLASESETSFMTQQQELPSLFSIAKSREDITRKYI